MPKIDKSKEKLRLAKEGLVKQVVDRLHKLQHIPDLMLKGGVAYAGYRATGHWTGALAGLVGLRLATSDNMVSGAAGVTTLGLIGLNNAFRNIQTEDEIKEQQQQQQQDLTSNILTNVGEAAQTPGWIFNYWYSPWRLYLPGT